MRGLNCALLVTSCAVCVLAIPSSLLTDVKQAEGPHVRMSNKVKRAQEVIMFGNQQNRGGEGRNAYRAEKRGVDLGDVATDEPLEEPKALPQFDRQALPEAEYTPRFHNSILKSEYFTDPAALTDLRYYDLDERRKRETFRTPFKRSSRGLSTTGRSKRDLDLDPEELLTMMSILENVRRNKMQQNRNMYNQYNNIDSDDMEMLENPGGGNDFREDDEPKQDGWMDGPVALPSHHFSVNAEPWERSRFSDDRRKRFMVSKRRPQDEDMYSLAQLLNGPQRDIGTPVFRRYVL